MSTLGLELSDAGLLAASCKRDEYQLLLAGEAPELISRWPGFAFHDGKRMHYGNKAEDFWWVHPRHVVNNFFGRLNHDPVALTIPGKIPSQSEVAFHFLEEVVKRLSEEVGAPGKVTLAVPGAYLKDSTTEEERVGLLLGIAQELHLPLTSIMDMASAGLADPIAPPINPSLPVLVLDVHLHAAEMSLLVAEDKMVRRAYLEIPQAGFAEIFKHLLSTMGNRFLRHTTFDIQEDGRIEQAFYRQTKHFMLSRSTEFRYYINTETRAYEMAANRELLRADTQQFVRNLENALVPFARHHGVSPDSCTLALTDRAAQVPGLDPRLRVVGFRRIVRLSPGAAARGAARMASQKEPAKDLADVAVEMAVPLEAVHHGAEVNLQTHLRKARPTEQTGVPTHVVIEGIGHAIGGNGTFTIGTPGAGADVELPEDFSLGGEATVTLVREEGRLWYAETIASGGTNRLAAVESGDRLHVHWGEADIELLFIRCLAGD